MPREWIEIVKGAAATIKPDSVMAAAARKPRQAAAMAKLDVAPPNHPHGYELKGAKKIPAYLSCAAVPAWFTTTHGIEREVVAHEVLADGGQARNLTALVLTLPKDWLAKNCGGWVFGEVSDELEEHAVEYPALASPLRRLTAGMRKKWAAPRRLMRVPKAPPSIQHAMAVA